MISLQIGFAILLEIITGQLWTAKMTTDWFGFSLEIQQWTAINMENNYTLSFCKVKTIGAQHQPPDKAYTLVYFFETVELTCFGNHYYYRLVLKNHNSWAMKTENDYRVVLEFSWKSALGMFRKKSLQIGLSIFLEINIKPFKEPTVWFIISLAKIEWVLFRSQGR